MCVYADRKVRFITAYVSSKAEGYITGIQT